jgi:UDP-N-acetylmuramoyl-tripeptide--D-alanyl-D-alanine ligase
VRQRSDGLLVIDDTYNANPASMRAALDSLRELALQEGRRPVAVLGEMKELGPDAVALHVALGEDIARAGVALVIGCGGLIDHALTARPTPHTTALRAHDVAEAAALARAHVTPGDVVLVKGSHSVRTERIVEELLRAP